MTQETDPDEQRPRRKRARRRTSSNSARGRKICQLQSAKNVIDHAQLSELRELDLSGEWRLDHAGSCAQWLSWFTGVKLSTAYERLRVAHALAKLPIIDDAMRRGEVSYTQGRALTRLPFAHLQAELLNLARERSGEALERGIREVRERAVADALPVRPPTLRAVFDQLGDGSSILRVHLQGEEASTVKEALHAIKQEDSPNRPSTMSDGAALALMANRAAHVADPQAVRSRYDVTVLVSAEALQTTDGNRPYGARCELAGGTQLSVETARRIACDSPIQALLVRKDGTPLDLGRRTRKVSKRLRKALIARDRHCTFPGCTSRLGLDAHHIDHWVDGGETKESNLTMLCRRHHGVVHDEHYRLVRTASGVEFRDRDGRIVPRGASVPRFSPSFPGRFDDAMFERYTSLGGALRMAVGEWLARSKGSAA